jgi:hypothetical protein
MPSGKLKENWMMQLITWTSELAFVFVMVSLKFLTFWMYT